MLSMARCRRKIAIEEQLIEGFFNESRRAPENAKSEAGPVHKDGSA
jgi:hypothetical protein